MNLPRWNSGDSLIFSGSPQSLGFARFVVFSIWLVIVSRTDVASLAGLPAYCYEPTGILRLFNNEMIINCPAHIINFLKMGLCGLLAVLALGIRPLFKPLVICGVLGVLCFESYFKGFSSFINHSHLGMLYAAIVMAFFPASDAFVLFRFKERKASDPAMYQSAMVFCALSFTLAYAFVGLRRMALGPEVLWNDSLIKWVLSRTFEPRSYHNEWGILAAHSPQLMVLMKAGFAIITFFEILSPLAVFHNRFRQIWLMVMIPFHFITLLQMNIFFWHNLIFIIVFLTGFSYVTVPRLWAEILEQRSFANDAD